MSTMHIDPSVLIPHEEVDEVCFHELLAAIEHVGAINVPILVEKNYMLILDGHHRCAAAKKLGLTSVPALLVDYDEVRLDFWRTEISLTKVEIVENALRGLLLPCKTTRHTLKNRG